MVEEAKGKCFVVMPFTKTSNIHTNEYWIKHYNDFLKPLIESHPLIAHRSSPLRGDILRQIITDLVTSSLVVADLTDANPNVYWELGVRQSFKHCTLTIAETGTKLPFDVGGKGTLFYYPEDHIKMSEFRRNLNDAIHDCLKNPTSPDSHVLETISGRGSLFQILMKEESLRKLDALFSEAKYNLTILTEVKEVCTNNSVFRKEGNEDAFKYETNRLRISSLENLIVNRYIEASTKFYRTAEVYLDDCTSINAQLDFYDIDNSEVVEQWLLSAISDQIKLIKRYRKFITEQSNIIRLSL